MDNRKLKVKEILDFGNPTKIGANEFYKAEESLNKIKFRDFELGVILSYYLDRLYVNDFEVGLFKHIKLLSFYFIKCFGSFNQPKDYGKNFIYFNRGKYRHYQEMTNSFNFNKEIRKQTIVIGPKESSDLYKGKVFFLYNLIDFFKIVCFISHNKNQISNCVAPLHLPFSIKSILYLNSL